jgi:hypothetical protein
MRAYGPNFSDFREIWLGAHNLIPRHAWELIFELCRKDRFASINPRCFKNHEMVSYTLRYFLATEDQVFPISLSGCLFHPSPNALKGGIRGNLVTLGRFEPEFLRVLFVCARFWGHHRVHWSSVRRLGTLSRCQSTKKTCELTPKGVLLIVARR